MPFRALSRLDEMQNQIFVPPENAPSVVSGAARQGVTEPTVTPERAALNAAIPESSRAAWTPEEFAAAETFLQTQDSSVIEGLSRIKRLRALDALTQYSTEARAKQEQADREAEQRLSAQELEDVRFVRQSTDLQAMRMRNRGEFVETSPELEREAIIRSPQYAQEWLREEAAKAQEEGVQDGDTVITRNESGETIVGTVAATTGETTTISTTWGMSRSRPLAWSVNRPNPSRANLDSRKP